MPREHALTLHAIARARRHDHHLACDCSGVRGQRTAHWPGEQHERAGVVAALEHVVSEYEILPEVESSISSTVQERDRALRDDLHTIECVTRSEEHTSELQSRPHLVCRLLLE